MEIVEKVRAELMHVFDPELNINVIDLGLVYDIQYVTKGIIEITMTLTTPGCPLHDSITSGVRHRIEQLEEVDQAVVNIVWEPAWTPEKMTEEGRRLLR